MQIINGRITGIKFVNSEHCDERMNEKDVCLLVIHNISLPPDQFGGDYVERFFTGQLSADEHPFFESIYKMRVSAHLFINRNGEIVQFVPFHRRAWHAGVSSFQGKSKCNDFSIGIEMEGTDDLPYTDKQYDSLLAVSHLIMHTYPQIHLGSIVGHQDIAPDRKTDPGVSFDWSRYRSQLSSSSRQQCNAVAKGDTQ
jgi:AmpD protein